MLNAHRTSEANLKWSVINSAYHAHLKTFEIEVESELGGHPCFLYNNALNQSRLMSRRRWFTTIKCLHRISLRCAGARV